MKHTFSRLPASELQIMQVLWEGHPDMSRLEIQQVIHRKRDLAPTTINSLLSRLERKGFVSVRKEGKNNLYTPWWKRRSTAARKAGRFSSRCLTTPWAVLSQPCTMGRKFPG